MRNPTHDLKREATRVALVKVLNDAVRRHLMEIKQVTKQLRNTRTTMVKLRRAIGEAIADNRLGGQTKPLILQLEDLKALELDLRKRKKRLTREANGNGPTTVQDARKKLNDFVISNYTYEDHLIEIAELHKSLGIEPNFKYQ